MNNSITNIVIAHYKENLCWLPKSDEYKYFIYSKYYDEDLAYQRLFAKYNIETKKLPNLGREGHTYLQHIIDYYDEICANPEKVTVFLQGRLNDHLHNYDFQEEARFIKGIIEEAKLTGKSSNSAKSWNFNQDSAHPYFKALVCSNKYNGYFKDWFEEYISVYPTTVRWWVAALFAIRNDFISCRPKEYYQKLLNCLLDVNPETVYFLERAWWHIFEKN